MASTLDHLVTAAAAELMAATPANSAAISQRILADLVGELGVDFSFLRHNDHTIHATVLIAEWPVRNLDPDPIGVIYFADADSVFAKAEHMKEAEVVRPDPGNADYQRHIEEGTGIPAVSLAAVPLLYGDVTAGTLGFGKFGDREWLPEELNALQTIATLFAQLQARMVAEEQIHYLAEHDDLTGLLNRRALITYLDQRLAEGQPGPVSVLFLDLDRFKVINDHVGQHAGDRFLAAFAAHLREASGVSPVIARFGSDQLVVVPDTAMNIESAESFAQSLRERTHEPVVIDGEMLTRTVSIGIAAGSPGRDSTSDLLRRVDQALRSAKSSGGNRIGTFSPEMSRTNMIRNDIELHLERIIDQDSDALVLHYLPEFDMRTGEILGTEALVRWQHPTLGLLMPDSFIGVVESINLAAKLGRLVMRSACQQFALWQSHAIGRGTVLRVNVSPVQLVTDSILDTVAVTVDEFGLDPASLCLEITESVVVEDIDATRKTLFGLKDIGVQIAIDDFGTGYSGLTYLKSLPVDILKIDRGFVSNLDTNAVDYVIVQSTMALAGALGLHVVAEGVETAAAAKKLLELGCYRAQGFLLSRPVPSVAMESLLTRRAIPIDFTSAASPDAARRRANPTRDRERLT